MVKLGRFWSPWPNAEGFYSPALALAGAIVEFPLFGLMLRGRLGLPARPAGLGPARRADALFLCAPPRLCQLDALSHPRRDAGARPGGDRMDDGQGSG